MTQYNPTGTLLMIQPFPDIDVTAGGIILPNQSRIQMNEGHILKVGSHAKGPNSETLFNPGDKVCWDENSEYRLDVDGDKFVLVNAERVLLHIPANPLLPAEVIATVAKVSEK